MKTSLIKFTLFISCALACAATDARARSNDSARGAVLTPSAAVPTPGEALRRALTIYVRPGRAVDAGYLQYKLLRTNAFADWGITIVEDERAADLVLSVEQSRLNYIFRVTDPRTSAVLVSGKVVAVNDPVAADFLGKEIVKRMREARRSR